MTEAELRETLAGYLAHPALRGAQCACVVRTLADPESLYSTHGLQPLIPASQVKLLVSATAVQLFGPGYTYGASAWSSVPLGQDGKLSGDLYLEGSADPTAGESLARGLAEDLQHRGLRAVSGNVVGVGPLLAYDPDHGLSGARRLYRALSDLGVSVGGAPREDSSVPAPVLLGRHTTLTLAEYLRRVNKHSDNNAAERLLRSLLARFDDPAAPDRGYMLRYWTYQGLDTAGTTLADGSGYSRDSRLTAGLLVNVLQRVGRGAEAYRALSRSLPVAGGDGTLADRMQGTAAQGRVRAKTGTLPQVSCLSGYVEDEGEARLVFSLLMNDFSCPVATTHRIQDEMAIAMAKYVRDAED